MGRWEPNAKERLAEAAMALFAERGYERTTVAEIAARAGLTERTFFRYFADKREVLFDGGQALSELMVGAIEDAPAEASPMEAVQNALAAVGRFFTDREHPRRRQALIVANPELQERELIKLATLATAVTEALARRGVPEPSASLSAQTAMGVFHVAFQRWLADGETLSFDRVITESLAELRTLVA